ncbi:MAG: MBOAT family protein [Clostridia bacterium]|nr:MBOAT family protein [Clostridia bacterium]
MLFSSLEFLYIFLPITVSVYFLTPRKSKNTALLVASLLFYAVGEPIYLFLMLAVIGVNFLFGFLVDKEKHSLTFCKIALTAAVSTNILLLGFFKYYEPVANALPFLSPLGIALPLGISFYSFQALSYVIDVYRGDVKIAHSIIKFSTYVSLFPQLVAGPIVRYREVDEALESRAHSFSRAADGAKRFLVGLSKKVLLANTAGEMWERMCLVGREDNTVFGAWLGIVFFAFQIYFDFGGYSDMAIGLGKIFGFDFPENFNYPYISRSATEFWRRWHITLSSFFREYVYIPLGGNRRGKLRTYLNLLAVWSLTGIWHGASINFLFWGLYYFLILAIEKAFLLKVLEKIPRIITHVYSTAIMLVGWVIFSADTIEGGAIPYLSRMFGIGATEFFGGSDAYELIRNIPLLLIMIFASTPLPKKIFEKITGGELSRTLTENALTALALLLCTARLVASGYNPFLYFRF